MKPSCARGSGELPRYVEWIDWRPPGGVVRLAGKGVPSDSSMTCATDDELRARCQELATQRYLFSIGGRAGWGPADIMGKWQEDGLMPLSFLQVSWTGPGEWQVHEIMPGVQQWDIRPLGDMLDSQPLAWTGPMERSLKVVGVPDAGPAIQGRSGIPPMEDDWHKLKAALVAHLGSLQGELQAAGQTGAAELFAPVAANSPESQFSSASEWLGEVELVAEAVMRRFPPPSPLDAKVREAKRLARVGLYGAGQPNLQWKANQW